MKVCVITHNYPRFNGDSQVPFVESLAKEIAKLSHRVVVLAPYDQAIRERNKGYEVELKYFKYVYPKKLHLLGYSRTIKADIKLKKYVYLLAPLLFCASFYSLIKLTFKEDFAVLHAHWVVPNGFIAALVSKIRKIPLVVTLHGSDIFISQRNKLFGKMALFAFEQSKVITACSMDLKDKAILLGAEESKIKVIPWGADPLLFSGDPNDKQILKEQLEILSKELIVLSVGRLVYKKGFEYFIRAIPDIIRNYKDVKFVIVGGGELLEELKTLSQNMGIDKYVIFTGMLPWNEIPDYFAICDVFVAPSIKDKEGNVDGLPTVIPEAMASSKPIVASNIAGIPLVVADGETGLLVNEKNSKELSKAILRLLNSEELRKRFGRNSRERVENELNWKNIAQRFEKIFLKVT